MLISHQPSIVNFRKPISIPKEGLIAIEFCNFNRNETDFSMIKTGLALDAF